MKLALINTVYIYNKTKESYLYYKRALSTHLFALFVGLGGHGV
jgi:hypothetical protein